MTNSQRSAYEELASLEHKITLAVWRIRLKMLSITNRDELDVLAIELVSEYQKLSFVQYELLHYVINYGVCHAMQIA